MRKIKYSNRRNRREVKREYLTPTKCWTLAFWPGGGPMWSSSRLVSYSATASVVG